MKLIKNFRPHKVIARWREHLAFADLDIEAKRLRATDGWMAISLPVAVESGDVSGPLPAEVFEAADDAGTDHIVAGPEMAEVSTVGPLFHRGDMSRRLPPFDKAIPAFRAGDVGTVSISIDPTLLLRLAKAIASEPGVTLTIKVPADGTAMADAILVTPGEEGDADGAIAALMPRRSAIKHNSRSEPVGGDSAGELPGAVDPSVKP